MKLVHNLRRRLPGWFWVCLGAAAASTGDGAVSAVDEGEARACGWVRLRSLLVKVACTGCTLNGVRVGPKPRGRGRRARVLRKSGR